MSWHQTCMVSLNARHKFWQQPIQHLCSYIYSTLNTRAKKVIEHIHGALQILMSSERTRTLGCRLHEQFTPSWVGRKQINKQHVYPSLGMSPILPLQAQPL